jgi:tetratricopeptide (TPR) repeat protein
MTRRARVVLASVAAALAIGLAPQPAASAPATDAQRALDRGYEADALFAKGKWDEAYDLFRQADALAHSPVFVLYMARCRRNAGRLLEAAEIYARVTAEALGPSAPKPFRGAVDDASSELAEVRARIPSLVVEITGRPPGDVELRVDGRVARIGEAIELDPGEHVVLATAPGVEAKRAVLLKERGPRAVVTLALASPAKGQGAVKRGSLVPGILSLSFAAAGLELGAITGALAARDASVVKEGCVGERCLRQDAELLDRANTLATVSTVGFVVGGVALTTGIVLIAVRPGGETDPVVTIGPTGARLQLSF